MLTEKGDKMEDEMIISLYNKRSEQAITETQQKYGRACYGTAFGILKNNEDSEECVNDTYLRTWNSIPPECPSRLGAFVCRITRNLALDRHRAKNAEKRASTVESSIDELAECIPSWSSGVEDKVMMADLLNRFLSSQPPQKRMIFMRRYFYMDTPGEIAKRLTTTEASVKMTLSRLRRKLKEYLEREGVAV